MLTPTHVLLTLAAGRSLGLGRDRLAAAAVGAAAPDVPLVLLAVGEVLRGWLVLGLPWVRAHELIGERYFTDPWWIAAHQLLHAPVPLLGLLLIATTLVCAAPDRRWPVLVLVGLLGAAGHAGIDVLTHRGDGPLLGFPLDWSWRWEAPVSYRGPWFHSIERVVMLGLMVLLLARPARTRADATRTGTGPAEPFNWRFSAAGRHPASPRH